MIFQRSTCLSLLATLSFATTLTLPCLPVSADGGVTLQTLNDPGLEYSRVRSPEFAAIQAIQLQSLDEPLPFPDILPAKPEMTGGFPGVVVWDYDGDGDQDIYAANGPGAANSLFQNQLAQTGSVSFVDVAAAAGLEATAQDSAGVCAGDLDNDGDPDLVVLGRHASNHLYENLGDGTFRLVAGSAVGVGDLWSSSCTLGDVDGDGLLDLFVANTAETFDGSWIYAVPFALNEHNQLFRNDGGLQFSDVSATAGVEVLGGLPAEFAGSATVTWATAMADLDRDGDIDIVHVDDQAGFPMARFGGIDRGLIHVLLNDGSGRFTDHPILGPFQAGTWMGVDVGDLDCDGTLDLYVTNFGDYVNSALGAPPFLGLVASRWFLGGGDGTFTDVGTGALGSTGFGWGNAVFDYDNDADLDLLIPWRPGRQPLRQRREPRRLFPEPRLYRYLRQ